MLSVRIQTELLTRVMTSSDAVARILAGREWVVRGQKVPLRTRLLLRTISLDPRPRYAHSVARQRAEFGAFTAAACGRLREVEVADHQGPHGLLVRVYRPRGTHDEALPALLYLHGGGFVIGSVDSHDALTRRIAEDARCVVASVEYRLAPEHLFPTAVDDAHDALRWLCAHAEELGVDAWRIAVGGDSAGGNLAAVVSQLALAEGGPSPRLQFLIYPSVTSRGDHASRTDLSDGFMLSTAHVDWYLSTYTGGAPPHDDTRLSPVRAESLQGLPTALVVVAGLDPLHDEGVDYAERLRAAGVTVELIDLPGMIHGFVNLDGFLPEADAALTTMTVALKRLLHADRVTEA
jgi:acetyl esterase